MNTIKIEFDEDIDLEENYLNSLPLKWKSVDNNGREYSHGTPLRLIHYEGFTVGDIINYGPGHTYEVVGYTTDRVVLRWCEGTNKKMLYYENVVNASKQPKTKSKIFPCLK